MKVMLVEPYGTRLGHFGLYASQIGQELSSLGHEVVVVTGTRLPTHKFLGSKAQFRIVELGLSDTALSADSSTLTSIV